MAYNIINAISTSRVPQWGNMHEYICIHYLGVDGQNHNLEADGCGAHYYIYWDGTIYQRCAHDAIVWAVGTAGVYTQKHPKARNSNTISIELCCHCDGNKSSADDPKWYFTEETQKAAVWLTQKLMRELNIPIENVLRHWDIVNKVCPAPYVHNNKYKTSWTWNEFLSAVSGAPVQEKKWYRVRKSWTDEKSQLGAYEILENAKKNCPVGYSVFDDAGKAVYTPSDAVSAPQAGKYPSGVPTSKEAFIEAVGAFCKELAEETNILASVVTAQCCLETGYGLGEDARVLVNVNNLLGLKSELINSSWADYTVWNGKEIRKMTPEYQHGQLVNVPGYFRCYQDYHQCIYDYEQFLLHVRNSKGYKYASVRGMTDPAAVIRKIRIGTGTDLDPEGYATDPAYETKVLKIIRENNLTRFDNVQPDTYAVRKSWDDVKSQTNTFKSLDLARAEADRYGYKVYEISTGKEVYSAEIDRYAVAHELNDTAHRLGLFHELENAKNLADINWGYKVWDIVDGKLIYEPKLSMMQKFVSEMVYMDQLMHDDISAKKPWKYKNKNTASFSKTFDDARKDNNRFTNCVSAVQWALLRAGVPRSAIQWYGSKGIVWCGADAEKNAKKYFNIIDGGGKTVKAALKDGTITTGDIVTYKTLSHTNAFIVSGQWFDSGHANCDGSGEGAKFKSWTCQTPYGNYKVAKILRLK